MGDYTIASGSTSTSMGYNTTASGNSSTAMGNNTKSKSFGGLSIGLFNDSANVGSPITFNPLNRIFQIGNGTADNARSNAMTVLQNGNVGIGKTSPVNLLDVNGNVSILSNVTVQNGKGIIRSTDGTQKKELSTNVVVNVSLAAGASTSINFTFPEAFSGNPDVYVGNVISGAGGWAEVIMTIANVTTSGGVLYVHNSTNGVWTPNFTVKVIAIGPQ